jgi:hypothetical protein
MNWLYYLLEANFYLAVFYLLYYFVFSRETWYQLNRAYLLLTSLLAFIIPLIQLGFLKPAESYQQGFSKNAIVADTHWKLSNYLMAVYLLVACLMLINLAIKIYKLICLSRDNKKTVTASYKLIETTGGQNAFSFFNYLFISSGFELKQVVIDHELIHIRQKHSWDIIYLELLKIISWFNPIIYLLQHSIKELHEFIADNETAGTENNTIAYAGFLLNNAYGISGDNLTSTFFNKSLLKKRIIMLHQKRSGKSARLKYLLALPTFVALLCLSTFTFSKDYGWINIAPNIPEITIDAYPPIKVDDISKDKALNTIKITRTADTGKKYVRQVKFTKPRKPKKLTTSANVNIENAEVVIDEPKTLKLRADIKGKVPPPPMPPNKPGLKLQKIPPPPPPMPPKESIKIKEKIPSPPPPQKPASDNR